MKQEQNVTLKEKLTSQNSEENPAGLCWALQTLQTAAKPTGKVGGPNWKK